MGYRIAIDVGGTFTDVVVADGAGRLTIGKGLTTRERIFRGMEQGLAVVAEQIGEPTVSALLRKADLFIYGTTTATNAVIEGKTGKTAFLTTEGFPDILVLREGGKTNAYDFTVPYPDPYVPRRLTFEIRERMDAEGAVVLPLDEGHARGVLRALREQRIAAIGVCLLWSIINPAHEATLGRLIEEELPGIPYTLSHQLNPIIREYRRASSTVIDASLKPLMQRHLREVAEDVRGAGFGGEILCATSSGGVMHLATLVERPINSVRSGPALIPVAALHYALSEVGARDAIVCDTGGTSFDVSLVRDGLIKSTRETWLGGQWVGHMTGLSSVDVRSIGAGGGSIVWIDAGGLLRVGPQSAGADPGPACYGRGGSQPTVTDAALVLGYLDPAYFLGGRMSLDGEAARRAVGTIAERIGQPLDHTAQAILLIAGDAMVQAIREITVNEGVDPRDTLLVAGGGAAGLNVVSIARELGCRRVLVPRTAGALGACGAQYSDIVAEFSVSKLSVTNDFAYDGVNATLRSLHAEIDELECELRARGVKNFRRDFFVEARYPTQVWELEVPLKKGQFDGPQDVAALVQGFHRVHERVFAVKEEGTAVECLYWKGRLTGLLERTQLGHPLADVTPRRAEPHARRAAYFAGLGRIEVPIYFGMTLTPGMRLDGPAIIEEPTTTIVLYPGSMGGVTSLDNYLISIL
ncbi:MAG TPA: hydantoinase/oxoprolinase family protein [Candidatus Binatia bacterium]|jgi:N-methylhydantoinase A|nr:hydantoinase/oxoprolinase family protein [Candidatus Binatia bacterium]